MMDRKARASGSLERAQISEFGSEIPDLRSAVADYRRAALDGNGTAQYFLALAYALGDGVRKNRRLAMTWFSHAVVSGEGLCKLFVSDGNPSKEAQIEAFHRLIAVI